MTVKAVGDFFKEAQPLAYVPCQNFQSRAGTLTPLSFADQCAGFGTPTHTLADDECATRGNPEDA
jgi:hypothetical protein